MNTSNTTERDHDRDAELLVYPARKARGAEIILKSRMQRLIFFGGAAVGLALILLLMVL